MNFYINQIYSVISDIVVWFSNLTFLSLLKLIFLILFILINSCLIYFEYLENKNKKSEYIAQGISNELKRIGGGLITGAAMYSSYISIKNEHKDNRDQLIELFKKKNEELKKAARNNLDERTQEKFYQKMHINSASDSMNLLEKLKNNKLMSNKKISDLEDKLKTLPESTNERVNITEEIIKEKANKDTNNLLYDREFNNLKNIIEKSQKYNEELSKINDDEKIKEKINESSDKKSSVLDLEELFNNFESLNGISKLAVSMILSSSIIFWSLLGIFLNFYGNYLLERFKLEERYPKFANFIKYRKTLSKYYIISNFLVITSLCLINIIFGLSILFL